MASPAYTTITLEGIDAKAFYDLIKHPQMYQTEPECAKALDKVEEQMGLLSDTRTISHIQIMVRDEMVESE